MAQALPFCNRILTPQPATILSIHIQRAILAHDQPMLSRLADTHTHTVTSDTVPKRSYRPQNLDPWTDHCFRKRGVRATNPCKLSRVSRADLSITQLVLLLVSSKAIAPPHTTMAQDPSNPIFMIGRSAENAKVLLPALKPKFDGSSRLRLCAAVE